MHSRRNARPCSGTPFKLLAGYWSAAVRLFLDTLRFAMMSCRRGGLGEDGLEEHIQLGLCCDMTDKVSYLWLHLKGTETLLVWISSARISFNGF